MIKLEPRSFARQPRAVHLQLPLWLLLVATPFTTLAIVATYHSWHSDHQRLLAIDAAQGGWQLTSGNVSFLKEFDIDGERLVAPQVWTEDLTGQIQLYPLRVPRQFVIRFDHKHDVFLHGIYSLNDDELTFCVTGDSNDRPTAFVEDGANSLLKYRRRNAVTERR